MKLIGNIIWLIFGGWAIFLEYIAAGIAMCITVIGIPFGLQCFKMAFLSLIPFGLETESRSSNPLSMILNIIWFFIGGIWICLTHLVLGIVFCVTIIGLPFGLQHFKLSKLALSPFGYTFKS